MVKKKGREGGMQEEMNGGWEMREEKGKGTVVKEREKGRKKMREKGRTVVKGRNERKKGRKYKRNERLRSREGRRRKNGEW